MRWRAVPSQKALVPSAQSRFDASLAVHSRFITVCLAAACLLALPLVSCGPSDDAGEDPAAAIWSEVTQMQEDLAATRAELAETRTQLAAADEEAAEGAEVATDEGAEEGAEAAPTAEELEARIAELEDQAVSQAEEFTGKVIEYINGSGLVEGQPRTPEQSQAFDWKAEEDIRIAQEYIDKGGDYSRAIDIYNASLMSDPENQLLLDAKAKAEELQYMTEERFAAVEKGMSQDEVRAAIGTAHNRNRRDYEDENMIGWFYPRNPAEGGGAAGVFFKQKNDEWRVNLADFDAVKPRATEDESSE